MAPHVCLSLLPVSAASFSENQQQLLSSLAIDAELLTHPCAVASPSPLPSSAALAIITSSSDPQALLESVLIRSVLKCLAVDADKVVVSDAQAGLGPTRVEREWHLRDQQQHCQLQNGALITPALTTLQRSSTLKRELWQVLSQL